jgi:hypothetical protein
MSTMKWRATAKTSVGTFTLSGEREKVDPLLERFVGLIRQATRDRIADARPNEATPDLEQIEVTLRFTRAKPGKPTKPARSRRKGGAA